MKKITAMILSLLLVLSVSAPAFAATTQQITATYGISLYYNGQLAELTDANGNEVKPFTYMGTTYVPIRGVSNLFGAYVGYDDQTKSAYILDTFSEICAVVNRMGNIVNSCYQDLLMDMCSVGTNIEDDGGKVYKENSEKIERMFDVFNTIGNDNGNMSIVVNELLESYGKFIIDYADCRNAYVQLMNNKSEYYSDKYFDLVHKAIDDYGDAMYRIEKFFDDYCCWRDIGF